LATLPIKLKLELHIHGGLLIANHLDQSLWSTNQKYWVAVMCNLLLFFDGEFITLILDVEQLCGAFYQPRDVVRGGGWRVFRIAPLKLHVPEIWTHLTVSHVWKSFIPFTSRDT
jgi:hypothetical protein